MKNITLISGSTLGSAESLVEHLAKILEKEGKCTQVMHGPMLEELSLDGTWIIVSSTHGSGELPENLQPFFDELSEKQANLSSINYGAVGIGNREYDNFCGAIDKIDKLFHRLGARQIIRTLKINVLDDALPESLAEKWLKSWKIST